MRWLFHGLLPVATAALLGAAPPGYADPWQGRVGVYYWKTGIRYDSTLAGTPEEEYDGPFSEYRWAALPLQAEARKGRHSISGEAIWLAIKDDTESRFGFLDPDFSVYGHMYALAYGYAVHDSARTRLELTGGLRHWDANLKVDAGRLGSATASATITDPILGLRGEHVLGDRWHLVAEGSYGGFGIGAKRDFDLQLGATYRISKRLAARIGYRHLQVDFDSDTLRKLAVFGPTVGLDLRF